MEIKWLGHAAFLITSAAGTRIITDPYETGPDFRHGDIKETADIVSVSHGHHDHNNVAAVKGNPQVIKGSGTFKGVNFLAVPTAHDNTGGGRRGPNTVFNISIDGVNVCHCGDLGHVLTDAQVKAIGKVDVLMVPVGGFFTIDAAAATKVCEQLKPGIVLPMHYKTDKVDLPVSGVEDFLRGKNNVKRIDGSEIEVRADNLPASARIVVLQPAL